MSRFEKQGVVDLPVVLILCAFLASLAVALGARGLDRAESLRRKQKSIRGFDELVELSTRLGYGGVGGKQRINLELCGDKIIIRGQLVQLQRGKEIFRSEYLPLPLLRDGEENFTIRSGNFLIELLDPDEGSKNWEENRLVLDLSRVLE